MSDSYLESHLLCMWPTEKAHFRITFFPNQNKKRYSIILVVWLQKFIWTFLKLCSQSQKKRKEEKNTEKQVATAEAAARSMQ